MKTIFITSFHPMIFKNFLSTGIVKDLIKEARLIVLVPWYKKDYFNQVMGGYENIIIEGVELDWISKKILPRLMKRLAKFGTDTYSERVQKKMKWKKEEKFFYYIAMSVWGKIMSRSRLLRKLFRYLDYYLTPNDRYWNYFEIYKPDLVIVTDIQQERDVEVAQNAKKFNVPIIGMVRNWDNLTSHGIMRVLPDKFLAPSEMVKRQAIILNDLDSKDIDVVGIPPYDKYLEQPSISKRDFFSQIKFDSAKKLIFCALIGDLYIPNNDVDQQTLEILRDLKEQAVVRFHPTLSTNISENSELYPNIFFDRPGIKLKNNRGVSNDNEISEADTARLILSLHYSDIVICGPSTIALDAVLLDKPVIFIDFYPTKRSWAEKIIPYEFDHMKFTIESGAVRVAKSKEELLKYIDMYFKNPSLDSEGRARLREAYCGPMDGKSGERMSKAILNYLHSI